VLIINPWSGGGAAERWSIADECRQRGIDVLVINENDDLGELAAQAVSEGADCLGVAGGDGSLAPVAQVAARSQIPFVCVPAGTRNHFAHDLGLDRAHPLVALNAFAHGEEGRIDLGEVSGRPFLNNVSVGAYAEVVANEQYRDHKVGVALGRFPDVVSGRTESVNVRFADEHGTVHSGASVILISNNAYDFAPRPGFGSRACLTDGVLGVVVLMGGSLGAALRPIQWTASEFEIVSDDAITVAIDGEALTMESPLGCRSLVGALRVRRPTEASKRFSITRFGRGQRPRRRQSHG